MRLSTLKKTLAVSAFGLAVLFGVSENANAQTWKQVQKQQSKVQKQQTKLDRQQNKLENMRYRVYRNGSYYNTDSRGAELLRQAVNRGYQQGFQAGKNDRSGRRNSSYNNSSVYRNGNYGYQNYVDSRQYQYYFQQGFQRGYQDGFNSRNQYGSNNNGSVNILGTILQSILNIQQF